MIISEYYEKYYLIKIIFKNGSEDILDNVMDYCVDTDNDVLSILFGDYDLSSDKYSLQSIDSLIIIPKE